MYKYDSQRLTQRTWEWEMHWQFEELFLFLLQVIPLQTSYLFRRADKISVDNMKLLQRANSFSWQWWSSLFFLFPCLDFDLAALDQRSSCPLTWCISAKIHLRLHAYDEACRAARHGQSCREFVSWWLSVHSLAFSSLVATCWHVCRYNSQNGDYSIGEA